MNSIPREREKPQRRRSTGAWPGTDLPIASVGAGLFGSIGGSGVPAACVLLVLGWLDIMQYLALVAGSLMAYGFALWIAER